MRCSPFVVAVLAAMAVPTVAADPAKVQNLGIAVKAVTFANSEAAVGPSPEGGQAIAPGCCEAPITAKGRRSTCR